jgi:hypothetical protein
MAKRMRPFMQRAYKQKMNKRLTEPPTVSAGPQQHPNPQHRRQFPDETSATAHDPGTSRPNATAWHHSIDSLVGRPEAVGHRGLDLLNPTNDTDGPVRNEPPAPLGSTAVAAE